DEQKGEVSVEFAYLDWIGSRRLGVRAGLLLLPLGFVNEMHEPPTFLGARRPDTELLLLPTTWSDLGLGIHGEAGGFAYRAYLVNGLDSAGFDAAAPIREGRQGGSNALAEDFAFTGRVDWVGTPGLLTGVSGYTGNSAQGVTVGGVPFSGLVSLFDAHVEWRRRALQARLLFAQGWISDAAAIDVSNGLTGEESVPSRFAGGYAEAGYDVLFGRGRMVLIPFARFERYNTQQSVPAGYLSNPANDVTLWTFGVVFKPIPQIDLKADYQIYSNRADTGVNRFNMAMGFLF
ncbi:MAG: hypothetical protein ACRD1P_06230, partial [Thermoanaerobaculia bacterium]